MSPGPSPAHLHSFIFLCKGIVLARNVHFMRAGSVCVSSTPLPSSQNSAGYVRGQCSVDVLGGRLFHFVHQKFTLPLALI